MPASPVTPAPACLDAAELNAEIRRLARRPELTAEDRARLVELQARWRDAVEAEKGAT
jgi:hypothetical protein